MSKLLEDALAAVRQLPAERQDEIAQVMLDLAARDGEAADPAPVAEETPEPARKPAEGSLEKKARAEFGLGIEGILQKMADDDQRSPDLREEMREHLRDYCAGALDHDDMEYVIALYRRLYGKPRR